MVEATHAQLSDELAGNRSPTLKRLVAALVDPLVTMLSRFASRPVPRDRRANETRDMAGAESALILERKAHREIIDQMPLGVAMFWPNRKLYLSNRQFIESFGLSEHWLQDLPLFEELLDAMRANGRISEQRDFAAWKRAKVKLFEDGQTRVQKMWHLPNGRSQRITFCPNALGGLTMLVEDLTSELELKSACNALRQVQQATIDTMEEAIAVFGPDGRLRLHNSAFSTLWRISELELIQGPHIRKISEICAERIGPDETWNIVIAAVNATEADHDWNTIRRADGHTLSLTLTRLPDGGTMVSFADLTDYLRLESAIRPNISSAA